MEQNSPLFRNNLGSLLIRPYSSLLRHEECIPPCLFMRIRMLKILGTSLALFLLFYLLSHYVSLSRFEKSLCTVSGLWLNIFSAKDRNVGNPETVSIASYLSNFDGLFVLQMAERRSNLNLHYHIICVVATGPKRNFGWKRRPPNLIFMLCKEGFLETAFRGELDSLRT